MIGALAALLATTVFTVQDPAIDENSGMVDLGSLTVVTNDSGNDGEVFVLDARGRTVGATDYGTQVDAEALAPDDGSHVWVGDIGDNDRRRASIVVRRVPVGPRDLFVSEPVYRLAYPDGSHDAETLLREPHTGRLYVVTKSLFGGTVYVAPRKLSATAVNRLTRVADVDEFATDGAFLPGGSQVLIRGYTDVGVYAFPSFRRLADYPLPEQRQGESISVGPGGRVRIGSEGVRQPVLQVQLFDARTGAVAATAAGR